VRDHGPGHIALDLQRLHLLPPGYDPLRIEVAGHELRPVVRRDHGRGEVAAVDEYGERGLHHHRAESCLTAFAVELNAFIIIHHFL